MLSYSQNELARYLGVSKMTVLRWRKRGLIPAPQAMSGISMQWSPEQAEQILAWTRGKTSRRPNWK